MFDVVSAVTCSIVCKKNAFETPTTIMPRSSTYADNVARWNAIPLTPDFSAGMKVAFSFPSLGLLKLSFSPFFVCRSLEVRIHVEVEVGHPTTCSKAARKPRLVRR